MFEKKLSVHVIVEELKDSAVSMVNRCGGLGHWHGSLGQKQRQLILDQWGSQESGGALKVSLHIQNLGVCIFSFPVCKTNRRYTMTPYGPNQPGDAVRSMSNKQKANQRSGKPGRDHYVMMLKVCLLTRCGVFRNLHFCMSFPKVDVFSDWNRCLCVNDKCRLKSISCHRMCKRGNSIVCVSTGVTNQCPWSLVEHRNYVCTGVTRSAGVPVFSVTLMTLMTLKEEEIPWWETFGTRPQVYCKFTGLLQESSLIR